MIWLIAIIVFISHFFVMGRFYYNELRMYEFDSLGVRRQLLISETTASFGSVYAIILILIFDIMEIDFKYLVIAIQPAVVFIQLSLFWYPLYELFRNKRSRRSNSVQIIPENLIMGNEKSIKVVLKNFLADKNNFNAFVKFLGKEMNTEIATFLIEVEMFKSQWNHRIVSHKSSKAFCKETSANHKSIESFDTSSFESIEDHAHFIISSFVMSGADLELNLSHDTKKIYNSATLEISPQMFQPLEEEVYNLLEEDAFERFKYGKDTKKLFLMYKEKLHEIMTLGNVE